MTIYCVDHGWQPWRTSPNPVVGEQFRDRCEAWGPIPQGTQGLPSLAHLYLSLPCFGKFPGRSGAWLSTHLLSSVLSLGLARLTGAASIGSHHGDRKGRDPA